MEVENAVMPLIGITQTDCRLVKWYFMAPFEIPQDRAECIPNLVEANC